MKLLAEYLKKVFRRWWVWVSGLLTVFSSTLVNTLGVERVDPPPVVQWTALGVILFIAQFLAWKDIRRDNDELKEKLHSEKDREETLAILTYHRAKLTAFMNEIVNSEEELDVLIDKFKQRRTKIADLLSRRLSRAEADLFKTVGTFDPTPISGIVYNEKHQHWRLRMRRDIEHLQKLVEQYGKK